jgi:hypothetical protein
MSTVSIQPCCSSQSAGFPVLYRDDHYCYLGPRVIHLPCFISTPANAVIPDHSPSTEIQMHDRAHSRYTGWNRRGRTLVYSGSTAGERNQMPLRVEDDDPADMHVQAQQQGAGHLSPRSADTATGETVLLRVVSDASTDIDRFRCLWCIGIISYSFE